MKHPVVKLLWMIAGALGLVWIFLATLQKEIPSAVYLVLLVLAFLSALAAICLATLHDSRNITDGGWLDMAQFFACWWPESDWPFSRYDVFERRSLDALFCGF